MAEKKTTISKRGRGRPATRKIKKAEGQDFTKRLYPKDRPDPEDGIVDATTDLMQEDTVAPSNVELDPVHSKYPPPRKNPEFAKRWRQLIAGVVSRDNFKMGHLYQLEILCDLYVEYDELAKFIRVKGHTYTSIGRNGKTIRPYPQVNLLSRNQSEIRNYCKMLGLIMNPDKSRESGGEGTEWA